MMKTLTRYSLDLLVSGVDTVLPPRCALSGEVVDAQGMLSPESWAQLEFIGHPICSCCGIPFEYELEQDTLCSACVENRPPYRSARSAMKYNEASRDLILGFKHGDQLHTVRTFTPWLMRAGAQLLQEADVLIPVPLHRWRLWRRRYNQAALIAQHLSKSSNVPVLVNGLERTRATMTQGHMKAAQRHKNVKHAFALNPQYASDIKGKAVVLVDDVLTTGATVKECTKTLLAGGVKSVDVLTIARSVRPEF